MPTYYDDNFGCWEDMDDGPDGEDNRRFYRELQQSNVEKVCRGCGRTVRIQPDYAYCNSCAERRERGEDI